MPLPKEQFLPESAKKELAGRAADLKAGGVPELLRKAGKEMYDNPVVNTAIRLSPGIGDAQAGLEALASAREGDWTGAALNGVGVLPFIPALRTVWHGSPHKFDAFDMSKIGTGEGAQAYGHGLYFADSPGVAKDYQRRLGGLDVNLGSTPKSGQADTLARRFVEGADGDIAVAASRLKANKVDDPALIKQALASLNGASAVEKGQLYKVDLPDEHIAKMLDWDAPLSKQPQSIRDAIGKLVDRNIDEETGWLKMRGEDALRAVDKRVGMIERGHAEKALLEQGVPGIKYLDQGSRGAGEGSRNYVVFDDKIPKILERNGNPLVEALRESKEIPISDLKLNESGSAIAKQAWLWGGKNYQHKNIDPISVVKLPSGEPYVLDGYHRVEQARRNGQKNIAMNELPLTDEIKEMLINDKVLERNESQLAEALRNSK